ncbi:hypothetical protein ONZ51_g8570 [Trametes cubensis]|uniref:F-box domain-containing protein n=1 Tax=Trametes cubensis TaxID=1111947 RepID=A0AAD7X948_9APHY|nr:hypothetical protein ONZ51_g8570 [Trametes cubensis]
MPSAVSVNLLALNEDSLWEVLSYLRGTDAVHMALTCKYVYKIMVPLLARTVACRHPEILRRVHNYMATTDSIVHQPDAAQLRASHLRTLIVACEAFLRPELVRSRGATYNMLLAVRAATERGRYEFIQVPLLSSLLTYSASNIRRISLGPFSSLLEHGGSAFEAALKEMRNVVHARFDEIGNNGIEFLRRLGKGRWGQTLRFLELQYIIKDAWHGNSESTQCKFAPLLSALSAFPRLTKLAISTFETDQPDLQAFDGELISFASIQTLELCHSAAETFLLIPLCPNLLELTATTLESEQKRFDAGVLWSLATRRTSLPASRARWPTLRYLSLLDPAEVRCLLSFGIGPVHHVQVPFTLALVPRRKYEYRPIPTQDAQQKREKEVGAFAEFLARTDPVCLSMSIGVGKQLGRMSAFWAAVAQRTKRLRYLELSVTLCDPEFGGGVAWVENIPDALAPLGLIYLRLTVISPWVSREVEPGDSEDEDPSYEEGQVDDIQHSLTAQVVSALPVHLNQLLPTLRFLSLTHYSHDSNDHLVHLFSEHFMAVRRPDIHPAETWMEPITGEAAERVRVRFKHGDPVQLEKVAGPVNLGWRQRVFKPFEETEESVAAYLGDVVVAEEEISTSLSDLDN